LIPGFDDVTDISILNRENPAMTGLEKDKKRWFWLSMVKHGNAVK
jgi:hypothetical protein